MGRGLNSRTEVRVWTHGPILETVTLSKPCRVERRWSRSQGGRLAGQRGLLGRRGDRTGGQTQGAGHGSTWPETWVEGWAAEGNEAGSERAARARCGGPWVLWSVVPFWQPVGRGGQTGAGSPVRRRLAFQSVTGARRPEPRQWRWGRGKDEFSGPSSRSLHQPVSLSSRNVEIEASVSSPLLCSTQFINRKVKRTVC